MEINQDFTYSLGPIYPKMVIGLKDDVMKLVASGRVTEVFIAIEHIHPMFFKE